MSAGGRFDAVLGADATEPVAPPRANGELVFDAPWESRAFGVALAMAEDGVIELEELRRLLIEEIAAWERTHARDDERWSYYERWLAALERLTTARGLLRPEEIEARVVRIAHEQAHEHDHEHPHDHDHHEHHREVR